MIFPVQRQMLFARKILRFNPYQAEIKIKKKCVKKEPNNDIKTTFVNVTDKYNFLQHLFKVII